MAAEEQILHYSQGLKYRIRVEIERSEVNTLPEAMRIADRMDSIYNHYRGPLTFGSGPDSGPVPMEIGQMPQKIRFKWRSAAERRKLMKENKCFVCGTVGCSSSQHPREDAKN